MVLLSFSGSCPSFASIAGSQKSPERPFDISVPELEKIGASCDGFCSSKVVEGSVGQYNHIKHLPRELLLQSVTPIGESVPCTIDKLDVDNLN